MTESNMKVKADFEIIEAWTQTQKDPLIQAVSKMNQTQFEYWNFLQS